MKLKHHIGAVLATLATAIALIAPGLVGAQPLTAEQARALASDMYVYAYPLVLMDATRRQATNVPDASAVPMRAPLNQFAHFRSFPKAEDRDVVRYNFDTLYSFAWVDVTAEPIILSVPDTAGRYYLMPALDMWTDVFVVPGTRTTGSKPGHYALVARGWQGQLPKGVQRVETPTPLVWLMGRTQTNGTADYANVHKVQDGYKLTPLSQWGTSYVLPRSVPVDPAVDNKTPPLLQVNRLDGVTMLTRFAELMKKQPPHASDYPTLMRMSALGLEQGKSFDVASLDAGTVDAINAGAKDGMARLIKRLRTRGERFNGWSVVTETVGSYGSAYERRALIALMGLGANLPEDAIYPNALVDSEGRPLSGAHRYAIHFGKDQMPPADAFWSLTLYDEQGFQVPNPIGRFAIGDRDKLAYNADGSLDIYVQAAPPEIQLQANWLPATASAPFALTMRVYQPRPEALNGGWVPPAVRRID